MSTKELSPPKQTFVDDAKITEAAILALTEVELSKLRLYGKFLLFKAPTAWTQFETIEELINEAIFRTLDGRRKWNTDRSFFSHLVGVMKSCVFHARKSSRSIHEHADIAKEQSLTSNQPSDSPEHALCVGDLVTLVFDHFKDDVMALNLLEGWREGFSGPEIMELHGLSRSDFETIARRIRRFSQPIRKEGT